MAGGRTAHSTYGIPVKAADISDCDISEQRADLIREADLLIWDEVAQMGAREVNALDILLQRIMGVTAPFGNKRVLFACDLLQQAVIVPHAGEGSAAFTVRLQTHFSMQQKMKKRCRGRAEGRAEGWSDGSDGGPG